MFCVLFGSKEPRILAQVAKFVESLLERFPYEKPMKALEVRQSHTTRVGRITQRPKYLLDFFV